MNSGVHVAGSTPDAFGSFVSRLRALVVDAAVTAACLFGIILLFEVAASVPGSGRLAVAAILGLVLLYEPVMVSRYGGTVGHRRSNLRVVDERTGVNPSFPKAALRFVLKSVLGIVSFATMALTQRHQAVHDSLTGTTVRIHDLAAARPEEVRWERAAADVPGLPSKLRRLIVVGAYAAGLFAVLSMVAGTLISETCAMDGYCTSEEDLLLTVGGFAWMAATAGCLIAGWRGRLWGARVRRGDTAAV